MRPGPDPGTPLKTEPKQKNRQWQVQGQGSAAKSGPFQDHPILPEGRALRAKKHNKDDIPRVTGIDSQ